MKRLFLTCFAALLLSSIAVLASTAQTPVGQILGTVKDPSGLALPGATVVVTNLQTGQKLTLKSNEGGDYLARELQPGNYSVTGSLSGFKEIIRTPITLAAFQNARIDLPLEIGAVSDEIVVSSAPPQVDTHSNTLGALVDQRQITEMPIADRNIINTLNYTPGVQHVSPGNNVNRNQQRLNIQGNRAYSTNVQLDGASMYFAHRGQAIELPTPDAIQEVQVITSGLSAQYGRGTAVFAAVTKSGGNQLHGTAWEFIRNDAFDSTPYFNTSKPLLRSHDYGASIGGPIIKNKLFFFVAYQGLRIHTVAVSTSAAPPNDNERKGLFPVSAGKIIDPSIAGGKTTFPTVIGTDGVSYYQIPTSRFDPIAVKILEMVPLPNRPDGGLTYSGANPTSGDGVIGKFDYVATTKDQLSFRWFWDYKRSVSPFPASPVNSVPNYAPSPNSQDPKSAEVSYVRTWTPSLLSTTRYSFTKWVYDEGTVVTTSLTDMGAKNFVDQYVTTRPPTITVGPTKTPLFSVAASTIDQRAGTDYGLSQDWNWVHGAHQFKWGTLIERLSFSHPNSGTSSGTFNFTGTRTGNAYADYLLGTPTNFSQSSGSVSSGHYYPFGFYGEDTWKATSRLTLTLGLRSDIYTAWRENSGQQAMYIPGVKSQTFEGAPVGMVYQTDPQYSYHTAWKNFGPRVGFAWDVFGDGRTSVRGGYGISYDPIVAEPLISGQQPYSYSITVNNPGPLSDPYANTTNPFPYKVNPSTAVFKLPVSISSDIVGPFRPMYNQSFTLTFERQLMNSVALSSSYVGNLSRHGYTGVEQNPAVYQTLPGIGAPTTGNTDNRRILNAADPKNPVYTSIIGYSSSLNTSYNAWQTMISKRLSHGLSFQGHYTWSRGIDQCSTEVIGSCAQQDPHNPAAEWAAGDFDRTHVAVITYIYELPKLTSLPRFLSQAVGGWQIAGINTFQSGNPFTVTTGNDNSLTGVGNDRPNQIGNPVLPGNRSRAQELAAWFNPAAFAPNTPGNYGTTRRNSLRSPAERRWDMSLKKVFYPHGERFRFELRGDFTNVLNHTVLGPPGASFGSGSTPAKTFGVISSTTVSGRVVRLGAHLEF